MTAPSAEPSVAPAPGPVAVDSQRPMARRQVALVDLLDRLLGSGVVLAGSLTLGIADVDLVRIDLRALVSSVNERVPSPWEGGNPL
ncbi:gas vesicle protein [Streptomyces reniochalinae]|uniref:Gas vesicle protein n=2 Tax=Streptomyces TaxID=1883 RepID=A0A367F5Z9_9ACTN|nr:gas vesicle protein [Streptomyces reniochalinae]RCG25175.1 gas vesicle protein [Streptomyces reniochalinae]